MECSFLRYSADEIENKLKKMQKIEKVLVGNIIIVAKISVSDKSLAIKVGHCV